MLKNKYNIISLLFFILLGNLCFTYYTGPTDDYYTNSNLMYKDHIYSSTIHTVQLHAESHEISQPILNLDSQGKLKLSFDELDAEFKNYAYTFIHCNSDWQPSNLLPNEYIDGFQENLIDDYQYSLNTLQKYVHYNAVFPSESSKIILSGNYLLKVFENGNPDNIIITKRFMVFQNKISIDAIISRASN